VEVVAEATEVASNGTTAKVGGPELKLTDALQGFGSGLDPDSIRSVDPDPYSESGFGSRRAKMTHKN
jgi:hypothetical protein